MNPWEVVAAKLDRFFFGHDHDVPECTCTDQSCMSCRGWFEGCAEQLAEAEETEEVWLGYEAPKAAPRRSGYEQQTPGTAGRHKVCNMCDREITGTDYNYCTDHRSSSMDSRRTASVEDGQDPLDDDPPVAAGPAQSTSDANQTHLLLRDAARRWEYLANHAGRNRGEVYRWCAFKVNQILDRNYRPEVKTASGRDERPDATTQQRNRSPK